MQKINEISQSLIWQIYIFLIKFKYKRRSLFSLTNRKVRKCKTKNIPRIMLLLLCII